MENRQLVHELLDVVMDVQAQGDYVLLEISSCVNYVSVFYSAGKFNAEKIEGKGYDYFKTCSFNNTNEIEEMIAYLKGIKKALTPGSN